MATSDNNNWLKDIHDRLGDYTGQPSEGLWDRIADTIDSHNAISAPTKPLIDRAYIRYAAEIAALIVIAALGYTFGNIGDSVRPENGPKLVSTEAAASGDANYTETVEDNTHTVNDARHKLYAHDLITSVTNYATESTKANDNQDSAPDTLTESIASAETADSCKYDITNWRHTVDNKTADPLPKTYSKPRLAVAVYTNSSYGGAIAGNYNAINMPSAHTRRMIKPLDGQTSVRSVVGEKWHPTVPVSFGISAKYMVSQRLGIESGISYTMLKQQRDLYYSDGMVIEDKSTVKYIGIPVKVSYKIAHLSHLSVYGSVGGRVERALSNHNHLTTNTGPVIDAIGRDKKGYQWSVNVSAGLEYTINKLLGVYIEPGIGYYFKEKGQRPVVYKEYPWTMQLETGLRFNL